MGSIRQTTRRAIEAIFVRRPFSVAGDAEFFIEGEQQVYFLGISEGYGTCSDLHGIDVAGFSNDPAFEACHTSVPENGFSCHGAVLLRTPRQKELVGFHPAQHSCVLVAEGILLERQEREAVYFRKTGCVNPYVCLV